MIQFGTSVKTACVSCKESCSHSVIYAGDTIDHLRCSACGAVDAFIIEELGDVKYQFEHQDHEALMARQGSEPLNTYSTTGTFSVGQYIDHTKFKAGYVLAVSPPSKMTVLFANRKMTLLCGPSSTDGVPRAKQSKTSLKPSTKKTKPRETNTADSSKVASGTLEKGSGNKPDKKSSTCPKCGQVVHSYNILKSPKGEVVSCMYCKHNA
ncbi:MAG: hypothetical protein GY847_19595 [Proteobacteria bacterium]|nr:hypothetical protein [Pseudomonadota bacterium]